MEVVVLERSISVVASLALALILASAVQVSSRPDETDVEVVRAFWATPGGGNPYPGVGPVRLVVYLKNVGSGSIRPDFIILHIPRPLRTGEGDNQSWISPAGPISPGQTVRLDFDLYVPASARPGRYNFTLELNYTEVRVERFRVVRETREEEVSFLLALRQGPEVRMVISPPESAEEGEIFKVWLVLDNVGSEQIALQSLRVTSPNAEVLTQDLGSPGQLAPGESLTREVYVRAPRDSPDECVILIASATYAVGGEARTDEATVSIPLSPHKFRFSVDVDRSSLTPGEENEVTIFIRNVGSAAAEDVEVSVGASEGLTVVGPSEFWLGDIPPGGEAAIEVDLLPIGSLQAYTIALTISPSDGEPDAVTVGFSSSEMGNVSIASLKAEYDGEKLKVRGVLANLGSGTARYVNVSLTSGPCRGESNYIGDLDSGETSGFYLSCEASLAGEEEVTVSAYYQASPGVWRTATKSTTVLAPGSTGGQGAAGAGGGGNVSGGGAGGGILTYLAAAAGIISGFFAGKIYVERRR